MVKRENTPTLIGDCKPGERLKRIFWYIAFPFPLFSTSDAGSVQNSPLLTVTTDGTVVANGRQRLTTSCQFNLYLFPFDTQSCYITFSSMNYDGKLKPHQLSVFFCYENIFNVIIFVFLHSGIYWTENNQQWSNSFFRLWADNDHTGRMGTFKHDNYLLLF